ncbi:MAG: hypothetical protein AB8G96_13800 [Phycisphaerales bacterium]
MMRRRWGPVDADAVGTSARGRGFAGRLELCRRRRAAWRARESSAGGEQLGRPVPTPPTR